MRPRTGSSKRGVGSAGQLAAPAARLAAIMLARLWAKDTAGAGPSDVACVVISDVGGGTQTPEGVAVPLGSFLMAM